MTPSFRRFNFTKISLVLTFLTGIFFASCNKIDTAPVMRQADRAVLKAAKAAAQTIYEAEQGVLNGAVVAANQPGYTGTGFADYVNATGDFIEWIVSASEAGSFSLDFRYANGGTTNRALKLQVNGVIVSASLAFSSTGGWATWSVYSTTANLIVGNNLIRLTTTGSNGPNIDHLVIKTVVTQSGIFEAEQAVLSGAVVTSNQPGYTGGGFADYVNASGDFIEWTVNAATPGSFSLQFRYANGGIANRPLQLQVNGSIVAASLAFSPTGGWATWSFSPATANLIVGNNTIRLTTTGSNGPNIDHLVIKAVVTQSGNLEAEQAVLSGAVVSSNQPGYTGSGFADYVNNSGDFIEWTVNAATPGSFLLEFRYTNGAAANRPLQLQVNGAIIAASLPFSPTGGWATWSLTSSAANLIAGANKIRLTTTGSNGPNIDNLKYSSGNTKHTLYMVDNGFNRLILLNQKDPSKGWTRSIPSGSRDLQLVDNNKILVSHGNGAAEYDRTTGAKGWSISTYKGVSTAQRLANGNTLIGWSTAASGSTPAKVILSEVNSAGAEVSKVTINNITTFRLARRLSNGHTLITGDTNNDEQWKVLEVDANGDIVWQQVLGGKGYVANRLANGETQATICQTDNKLLQLSPGGSIVKQWGGNANHPAAELRKFSGYSVVPNGNILIANWLGDGNIGTGPHAVEFDANNNLVWSWKDFSAAQTVTNLLVIE